MSADDELVMRAQTGDRAAFRTLFLTHRAQVARLVQRFVPANEVEDVSQEVFLHVHRSLASFRGDSRFSTWLYRLTLNVTRMHVRKQKSRPKLALAGDDEHGRLERVEIETPASEAERNERLAALRRLLADVAEKKREALILHDFEGLPAEEIAKIVDAPVMTVRTRVFYGRKELYAALAAEPSLAHVGELLVPQSSRQGERRTRTQERAPEATTEARARTREPSVEARGSAREPSIEAREHSVEGE